jgi:hypothetical protein
MAIQSPNQTGLQEGLLRTSMLEKDGTLSLPWQQFFTSVVTTQQNAPQAFTVTHSQRIVLKGQTKGSLAFETDTSHVLAWNGTAWIQLV